MATVLIVALVAVTLPVSVSHRHINVPGDDDHGKPLEHYLCNDTVSATLSNTTLALSADGWHALPNKSCVVSNIENLAITGGNSTGQKSQIYCPQIKGGLAFFNVSNLTLEFIMFNSTCSAPLPHEPSSFGAQPESTIYISHCRNVAMHGINVFNSMAFSILLVNAEGMVSVSNVDIRYSNTFGCDNISDYFCAGSGMVFYYHDADNATKIESKAGTTIIIVNSKFIKNFFLDPQKVCSINKADHNNKILPHVTASGLSFIFTQTTLNVSALIEGCLFLYNYPVTMLAVFNGRPGLASLQLKDIIIIDFFDEYKYCAISPFHIAITYKADTNNLTMTESTPITLSNITVAEVIHSHPFIYVSAYLDPTVKVYLVFNNLTCNKTMTFHGGSCITAEKLNKINAPSGEIFLHFQSLMAVNSKQNSPWYNQDVNHYYLTAVLYLSKIDKVIIEGNIDYPSIFKDNQLSAIVAYTSSLKIVGQVIFENNHGIQGGALSLYDSYLILTEGVNATFTLNKANLDGGAIYAYNSPGGYADTFCVLQFETESIYPLDNLQHRYSIRFSHNSESISGGVDVMVSPAYNCTQCSSDIAKEDLKRIYLTITNNTAIIRSEPAKVGLCLNQMDNNPKYGLQNTRYYTYPGVGIRLWITVVDLADYKVPANVFAELYHDSKSMKRYMLPESATVKSFSHNDDCSRFYYSVIACDQNLALEKDTVASGHLILFVTNSKEYLKIPVSIKSCPLGFQLTREGTCGCNSFISSIGIGKPLVKETVCELSLKNENMSNCGSSYMNCIGNISTVQLLQYGWLGYSTHSPMVLKFTDHCPFGYCLTHQTSIDIFTPDQQCTGHRRGQVCSNCESGYSVAFGTKKCMKCSNRWLLMILLYAALGVMLVLFLCVTHFTIDQGTVVGIILFGNLTIFGVSELRDSDNGNDILNTFLSMLNLDVGLPICFYDGMTEVVKTALQFAFPVYVWGIVLFVIAISKQSTYVANLTSDNSVQTLITLVHLSFVKVLRNVIYIFSPLKLYRMTENSSSPYEIDYMWYGNGTIPYGGSMEHGLLLAAASVFTIGFLLPYVVMSFAAPYCLRYRMVNRFRQIYETQYGPYKEECRYWFGARLLLLMVFSIVYALTKGNDIPTQIIIYQSLLVCFITLQCWIKPFKKPATNVIDALLVGAATLIYCFATYFIVQDMYTGMSEVCTAGYAIVGIVFALFTLIVLYHIVWFIQPIRHIFMTLVAKIRNFSKHYRSSRSMVDVSHDINYGATIQQSYTCDNYREPLLSSIKTDDDN